MQVGNGEFWLGDCLELMREIPDGSVDMVLCDLPYGTTQNKWDSVIPFEPLWEQYWRVCKPNAAVVLTAAQPFTSALVMSQVGGFKYSFVWDKKNSTGFLNAKKQPLRRTEDVLVFYRSQPTYNPEMRKGKMRTKGGYNKFGGSDNYGCFEDRKSTNDDYYPTNVVEIANPRDGLHPTQKPVALFEYLIRTYTNEGEHVLDNTAGSGTTAIAAENTGRRWTCIERDEDYYIKAVARVLDHVA
jgi:site-specific DNA-methyltransferase (adenine-specific)